MLWFTSDNHISHAGVIKYSNRPFSGPKEMDEVLMKEWNRVVAPDDHVWMLGDVGFVKLDTLVEYLMDLNGKKSLVLGNHDKAIRKNAGYLIRIGVFQEIVDYKEIKYNNTTFVLSHYPMRRWNKDHYGSFHLHGHLHGELEPLGRSVDVGIDAKFITDEYRPVSADEVFGYLSQRDQHIRHDAPRD